VSLDLVKNSNLLRNETVFMIDSLHHSLNQLVQFIQHWLIQ